MKEDIIVTKTERQLFLFEVFCWFHLLDLETIQAVIPIDRRMLQRDVKDLTDAGLINVTFSRKEHSYVKSPEKGVFRGDEESPARNRHLKALHRLGTLITDLYNDPIDAGEPYDRKKYTSCKEVYEEMFPDVSQRTRQRDFKTLCRLGYPIRYNREIRYYEFYESADYRTDFGLYKGGDGKLRRNTSTDYEIQRIPWDDILFPDDLYDDE